MKTLVLFQHHVERILQKSYNTKLSVPTTKRKIQRNKSVAAKVCLVWSLLLEKINWNESVTAKVCLETLVRNVLKESKLWNRTFKAAFW